MTSTGASFLAIIPGGLTCKLQPLDVSVNHPFKVYVREEWAKWMLEGKHTFTPSGRQRRATYAEVCQWVLAAWRRIKMSTIENGFRTCGLLSVAAEADESSSDEDSSFDGFEESDEEEDKK